jgi:superfamily I DNA and/or RNA helicase
MGELDRTQHEEIFTEVLSTTPCIIIYSQQQFEFSKKFLQSATQSAHELFETLLGEHECKIIYKGKDKKDNRKYQLIFEKEKLSLYLSVRPNKAEFNLNYISDEAFVLPTDPSEFKSANLKILAEDYVGHNLMDFLDTHDLMTSYREIKDFCSSLDSLKEPIREINREQSRKMWKAYIDGDRALNKDKKELFIVEDVGKISREFYNGKSRNTITIKIKAPTLQEKFSTAIKNIPSIKLREPKIVFKTDKSGDILFKGFIDISDDSIEEISSIAAENCYNVTEDIHHILSGTISLQSDDNIDELLSKVNASLNDFDAKYNFDKDNSVYQFKDDSEALYIEKLIQNNFHETLKARRNTVLTCRFNSTQNTSTLKENIKQLEGVSNVLDSVSGQMMIQTDGKTIIDLSNEVFQSLRLVSCRAKFTPEHINQDVEIDGLTKSGDAYIFTSNDFQTFRKKANVMHHRVIAEYNSSQFIKKEFDYGCFVIPNKSKLRQLQLNFVGNKQIMVKAALGVVELSPKDRDDYKALLKQIKDQCDDSIDIHEEPYHPSVVIKLLSKDVDYCKGIYSMLLEKLSSNIPSFTIEASDKDTYDEFIYSAEFEDVDSMATFKESLNKIIAEYPTLLTNEYEGNSDGTTVLTFAYDHTLSIRFEKNLRNGYLNEDINLIKASEYDVIMEAIDNALEEEYQDYDEIYGLKKSRSQILQNALRIGKCLGRKLDSIKFDVSDEFLDLMEKNAAKGNVSKLIHKGDYLQFPMIGKSSELKRLSDSMLRITNPNELYPHYRTKRIPAPANPRLPDFLFDPRYAGEFDEDLETVKQRISETKIESFLNKKQLEAVAKAVSAPDIAIIQGPPGTGKTTVIAEIIWQQILKKPDSKILLTSQTNLAVDNALERLQGRRGIRPIRILNASTDKEVDIEARRYILDYMDDWCNKPSELNQDNGVKIWIDSILCDMDENNKYSSVLEQWRKDLVECDRNTRDQFFDAYKKNVNLIAATCSICGSRQLQEIYAMLYGNNENAFDVVIMDEASKATPLEMSVPMVWGKKIIIIGDHKQLPPMMNEDNIITNLKKAGQEIIAENIESFKESQFEILFKTAFKLKPSIVATLDTQYRMHKQIMNTVGHFYSDELENGLICGLADEDMDNPDYNARGSRYHGLKLPGFIEPQTHAIWVNVETHESQPSGSTSFVNNGELNAIKTVLKALRKADGFENFMNSQEKPEDKEIGIITFYGAQYGKIKEMYKTGDLGKGLPCRINVVDKFQGMERNIIIISTVRSNKCQCYGFAEDIRRINVGFSRARRLLIVVGNRQFFRQNAHYTKSIDEMEHFDIKQLQDLVR